MYYDTHCHLDICKDIEKVVKNAKEKKVNIVSAGVNTETNRKTLELREKYGIMICLGIYPIDALKMKSKNIEEEIDFIKNNKDKISAVGEVGMDFKESEERDLQEKIFEKFISLAKEIDKPIIVHSRKAELECINVLEKMMAKKVVMHCFSGNFKLVERIINNKWFLSIPANVTFSEHFQKVIEKTPIEQLLCETDSPYLHPFKERYNEPANVIESYKKISEIKKISLKDAEKKVEENVKRIFSQTK